MDGELSVPAVLLVTLVAILVVAVLAVTLVTLVAGNLIISMLYRCNCFVEVV